MKGFNWFIVKGHRPIDCIVANPFSPTPQILLSNFPEPLYYLIHISFQNKEKKLKQRVKYSKVKIWYIEDK